MEMKPSPGHRPVQMCFVTLLFVDAQSQLLQGRTLLPRTQSRRSALRTELADVMFVHKLGLTLSNGPFS